MNRALWRAVVLGVAGLLWNLFAAVSVTDIRLSLGDIFILLAAEAIGSAGAAVAVAIAVIPEIIFRGDIFEALRLMILCLAIGLAAEHIPRLPSFVVTALLWIFVFGPAQLALESSSNSLESHIPVVAQGLIDTLLTLVSSALLLNSTIWATVTTRVRRFSTSSLLTHMLALIAMLTTFSIFVIPVRGESFFELSARFGAWSSPICILVLVFANVIVPMILGSRLAVVIATRGMEDLHRMLPPGSSGAFSGMSSDYWRRRNSEELALSTKEAQGQTRTSLAISGPEKVAQLVKSDLGICSIDRAGVVTFVNRRFIRYTQAKSEQVVGKNVRDLDILPEFQEQVIQLFERCISKGPRVNELRLSQQPDLQRFFEVASHRSETFERSSIYSGPQSVVITIKDITDRRTIETDLLRAHKLGSLGNFVRGITYSFNDALTAILGHASSALFQFSEDRSKRALGLVRDAALEAATLVRQLLEYAEDRKRSPKVENLVDFLRSRNELFSKMVGDAYTVEFSSPESEAVRVRCESAMLVQAVSNLIQNAKESYGAASGKIEVSVDVEAIDDSVVDLTLGASAGTYARIRVRDWGAGMTPDVLAHAFDPLFTTRSSSGHTGLGLSMVYGIVRSQDGFLTAESQVGKGTTVSVYLPIHEAGTDEPVIEAPTEQVSNDSEIAAGIEPLLVLVVEDEHHVRELLVMMLDTLGYRTESCEQASEALERNNLADFDIVIADMILPGMPGDELLKTLAEKHPGCRGILMTGCPTVSGEFESFPVLEKPFDLETLSSMMRKASVRESAGGAGAEVTVDVTHNPS